MSCERIRECCEERTRGTGGTGSFADGSEGAVVGMHGSENTAGIGCTQVPDEHCLAADAFECGYTPRLQCLAGTAVPRETFRVVGHVF
jgi:hypothetical protein